VSQLKRNPLHYAIATVTSTTTFNQNKKVAKVLFLPFLCLLLHFFGVAFDTKTCSVLQEISGDPSPLDGWWKSHNLRRLCYLVKKDLENIVWWYCLDDSDNDIPLLPVQNPHICI
jgi:hypothetical protein